MVEILEQGAVSFVAVPRAERRDGPDGAEEADRFFVVLAPAGERPLRRLAVRRGRLPDGRRGQRFYAHVDRLARAPGGLTADVRPPLARAGLAARVLAVGRYALARHGNHVHLAYALGRAIGRGPLATALGIVAGASFVLSVFRRSLPPQRRPRDPGPLAPATPDRLDVIGAEVALVAGERPRDGRAGPGAAPDPVGDALVGALLRRGPRPRVASLARAGSRGPRVRPAGASRRHPPAPRRAR